MSALCAALALAFAPGVARAETANATATSQAVVVAPLALVANQSLDFGRIMPTTTGGTVVLNPDTVVCSTTGGVVHTGRCQPAEFTGMGTRRMTLRVQIPTTPVTLTGPLGATMTVSAFTLDSTPDLTYLGGNGNGLGNGNRRYSIVPNSGIFTIRVGGTLNIAAGQRAGIYSGTFNVTVQYQ